MTPTKTRDSNMELLRITAMLLIMIIHASNRAIPTPDAATIAAAPTASFLLFAARGFSIMGVNVFVMLSGWYGIRPRLSRLAELLFQVLFFGCLCLLAEYWFTGHLPFSLPKTLLVLLMLDENSYWFVKCYLGLYVFAPVLNTFAENATRRQFAVVLCSIFGFQFVFGWVFEATSWIRAGYSLPFFMCLYLLARYMRIHQPRFAQLPRKADLSIYIGTGVFLTLAVFFLRKYFGLGGVLYFYNCPFVILAATHLLLFFSKLSLRSRVVNWLAISALAIYLTHSSSFLAKYYDLLMREWFYFLPLPLFFFCASLLIVVVFFGSILLDKLRMLLWTGLSPHLQPNRNKRNEN